MIDFGLKDRVVVVTGGASGIGKATALALACQGASVMIIDQHDDQIAHCVEQLQAMGAKALGARADVRDEVQLQAAAALMLDVLGPAYALAACAGVGAAARAEQLSIADWSATMDVNVLGLFLSCRVFGSQMLQAGEGAIVGVSSVFGLAAHSGRTAYVASKFAVNGVIKTLSIEWGRHGVRVNAVAPTLVDTPMLAASIPSDFVELVIDRTPMSRIAGPDDIAKAILMLMSDASAYVTGVVLPLDGGLTAGLLVSESGEAVNSKRIDVRPKDHGLNIR